MKNIIFLPVYNKASILNSSIETLLAHIDPDCEILVIDDGSHDNTPDIIKTSERVKYLRHENELGYGATILSGFQYATDLNFTNIIIMDIQNKNFARAYSKLLDKLNEGYDIVSLSRIPLLNTDDEYNSINLNNPVAKKINNVTGYNLADPFSPYKAFKLNIINKLEFGEFDEAIFIQAWVQSAFYGLPIMEIFIEDINLNKIDETEFLENNTEHYMNFIDAEKILYPLEKAN